MTEITRPPKDTGVALATVYLPHSIMLENSSDPREEVAKVGSAGTESYHFTHDEKIVVPVVPIVEKHGTPYSGGSDPYGMNKLYTLTGSGKGNPCAFHEPPEKSKRV